MKLYDSQFSAKLWGKSARKEIGNNFGEMLKNFATFPFREADTCVSKMRKTTIEQRQRVELLQRIFLFILEHSNAVSEILQNTAKHNRTLEIVRKYV